MLMVKRVIPTIYVTPTNAAAPQKVPSMVLADLPALEEVVTPTVIVVGQVNAAVSTLV